MENYALKLIALQPDALPAPQASIPYPTLLELLPHQETVAYGQALHALGDRLPFKTGMWPSFGDYVDDWFHVEVTPFKNHLYYCERGGSDLRKSCENSIDLAFEIFRLVIPGYTEPASDIAKNLDRLADQRLLIWLRMSSEIYHMYQINAFFGLRMAAYNVTWMCEELVRMGVFATPAEAFAEQTHVLKGLTLSGLPLEAAQHIRAQLDHG